MINSKRLIILTLMMPKGVTGLQTHFNAIAKYARFNNLQVSIINPFQYNRLVRRVSGTIGRLLNFLNLEVAVLIDRLFTRIYLRSLLKKELIYSEKRGEDVVIYSQDPLTASVAINLRKSGFIFRLVNVVHFNISEASEYVEKRIALQGGMLWRSLMANEKSALTQLDQIIFVSNFMQQVVSSRLPELSKVPQTVIWNFPLEEQQKSNEVVLVQSDIISIGTLEPRKNQSFLLKTLSECNLMGKRYTVNIIGDGPDRQILEQQARQLGVAQQVRFFGYQPDAARFIYGSRVFLHSSKMENLPIVLLEALRVGVPVFAAEVGGIAEVFDDGKEGYYLNLDDPRDAALKIISVLDSPQKWQQMSAHATKTFVSRFHQDVLGPRWINTLLGS